MSLLNMDAFQYLRTSTQMDWEVEEVAVTGKVSVKSILLFIRRFLAEYKTRKPILN